MSFTKNHALLTVLGASLLTSLSIKAADVFPIADQAGILQECGGLAYDGANYLAALIVGQLGASAEVAAQLISPTGALSGSLTNVGSGLVWPTPWATVAFGGGTFLEVWMDGNITSGVDIFGQRISPNGATVGSSFPLLAAAGSHGSQTISALAFGGGNFLVVWKDKTNNAFYGQIVTTDGALFGSEFLITSQPDSSPWTAAASDGTNFLVAWQYGTNAAFGVPTEVTYGEFVSSTGSAGSPFQISQTASLDTLSLAMAFDGTNYLVVWDKDTERDAHENQIDFTLYGRLVSPAGALSAGEVVLTGYPGSLSYDNQELPNLAFDGQNYLLVWTTQHASGLTNANDLSGQFFDRSANAVGPIFAALPAQGTNRPTFANNGLLFDGTRFVLAGGYGLLTPNSKGDFNGIAYWQSWGAFISTNPPPAPLDFDYTTNADGVTLTITGYTGPGGAVAIPSSIKGLAVNSIGTNAFEELNDLTSVAIPGSVKTIGASAFFGCQSLTQATIALGVITIGTNAFADCPLTSVTIPDSVTSIGNAAFEVCNDLTNVIIGNGVTSIGASAFEFCASLPEITIGNGVTSIGDSAFYDCASLTNVTILDGVRSIGDSAFYECQNLGEVMIGNGDITIGDAAFYDCENLTNVTIGSGLASLGEEAFGSDTALTLYFQGNAPNADLTAFDAATFATAYYLPGTTGWDDFASNTDLPTAPWFLPNPLILENSSELDVLNDLFGFTISWATNASVVVEACTNLANPIWFPVATNALTNGSYFFSEPVEPNASGRFYRVNSP